MAETPFDSGDGRWLLSVIAELPPADVAAAASIATTIDAPLERFVALTSLASVAHGALFRSLVDQAAATLTEVSGSRNRAAGAVELGLLSAAAAQPFLAGFATAAVEDRTAVRGMVSALNGAAQRDLQPKETLRLARAICTTGLTTTVIGAGSVANAVVGLIAAQSDHFDSADARAAAELIPELPPTASADLIIRLGSASTVPTQTLLTATRKVAEPELQATTYFALAKNLDTRLSAQAWKRGLDATARVEKPQNKAQCLVDVASDLPSKLLDHALGVAHQVTNKRDRHRAERAIRAAMVSRDDLAIGQALNEFREGRWSVGPAKRRERIWVAEAANREFRAYREEQPARPGRVGGQPPPRKRARKRVQARPTEGTSWREGLLERKQTDAGRAFARSLSGVGVREREEMIASALRTGVNERRSEHIVNTGITTRRSPKTGTVQGPLDGGGHYYFWLEVGSRLPESIEREVVDLPSEVTGEGAGLDVQLFSAPRGVELVPDASRGSLRVINGRVLVERAAATPRVSEETRRKRLYFPIRAPSEAGTYSFRCNIYVRRTLLQSRLISVVVGTDARAARPSSRVDYLLSRWLPDRTLAEIRGNDLCIMVNRNDDGTHAFRFEGKDDWSESAHLDALQVQDLIEAIREAFHQTSWGYPELWSQGTPYLYATGDQIRFETDIKQLAKVGFNLYDSLVNELGGGKAQAAKLRTDMKSPGTVQLAVKESGRMVPPLAAFYDYPLDAGAIDSSLSVCQEAEQAIINSELLENHECFTGNCPHYEDTRVVCPGGFWGFRHAIGQPVSLGARSGIAELDSLELKVDPKVEVNIAVCTDPSFEMRTTHTAALKTFLADQGAVARVHDTRDAFLEDFENQPNHLVYLYCHGGLEGRTPYIQLGPLNGDRLVRSVFRELPSLPTDGSRPRPLVVINGCHTADVEPRVAMSLVEGFVQQGAAGAIGTTITIFEQLATAFGKALMTGLVEGSPVGDAVRMARLSVLSEQLNPLGLLYVAYALPGVHLGTRPAA